MGTGKYSEQRIEGTGPSPAGAAVLEAAPIERLREMGRGLGWEVPRRIIELYLGDAPARVAELWRAHSAADSRALGEAAHSLKGSSANLGASSLAELCHNLEQESGDAVAAVGEAKLRAVEAEYGKVEAAMRRLLTEFPEAGP
jgi:HPt (histidine-containing phosphotransfer) domain-containing protein